MTRSACLFFLFPLLVLGQTGNDSNKVYQGLLWEISGNGLARPSYLYGTMHVSNRVAFHLSESFFEALEQSDIIALETNPEYWVQDLTRSELYQDFFALTYTENSGQTPLYASFIPQEPRQNELEYYLSRDQDMLNALLWRINQYDQDFEENTFLDLFIYQVGKKKGKEVVALEEYNESFKALLESGRYDKDAQRISDRQAKNLLGNFSTWEELQEDAYRKGDLDLLDTLTSSLYPGKYYRKYLLDIRNVIMAEVMDSLMQQHIVFTGVGAAHLPGRKGVISLLRERGYTVEALPGTVTPSSIGKKESMDEVVFTHPVQAFTSDDGFIHTKAPGTLSKLISRPYQEYVFADMANSAFYSIRRIPTYGKLYDKDVDFQISRIQNLLFENIPGKIITRDTFSLSGYPALDITNRTRKGDWQRYNIVFTPLEIIIFKVGGHKTFAQTDQPHEFFRNISLRNRADSSLTYRPAFGGFTVDLPPYHSIERYEGVFNNPAATFWAGATGEDGSYYAVAQRQYHDVNYLEEDKFELTYFVDQIIDHDDKFTMDTIWLTEKNGLPFSRFVIRNESDQPVYGEIHVRGAQYVMLLTMSPEPQKRNNFFNSFAFAGWEYPDTFREYSDTVLHITMTSPVKLSSYDSFLKSLMESPADDEKRDYLPHTGTANLSYLPTGEQLGIKFEKLHKYESFEDVEDYRARHKPLPETESFILLRDSLLYTQSDSSYYTEAHSFLYTDTNTSRAIRIKTILENGALYSLYAVTDTLGYSSRFTDEAFRTFRPSGDTLFGASAFQSRAGLFFSDLLSGDSLRVYEAKNSISTVRFRPEDSQRIKKIIDTYTHPDFEHEDRMNLLNRLAFVEDEDNIEYLQEKYYYYADSSAYQFKILETLADFNSRRGNRAFTQLILDETPFSADTWIYNSLFREFNDSLQLAHILFPGILELTDFEDYRSGIYQLLDALVDSSYIRPRDYRSKYNTILRFAKVELKKQMAGDQGEDDTYFNIVLTRYNNLLSPFAGKTEVKEHYQNLLKIRNKAVLADQLMIIDEHINVPDSLWNYAASENKKLQYIYSYLARRKALDRLNPEYRTQEALARSMVQNISYKPHDSIAFITQEPVNIKGQEAVAYFFRVKNEKDNMWRLVYAVAEQSEQLQTEALLAESGELFNMGTDNMEEIITDAVKDIRITERRRTTPGDSGSYFE